MSRSVAFWMFGAFMTIAFICSCLEGFTRLFLDNGYQFDLEMWKYAKEIKRISANPEIGHEHTPYSHAFLMGTDVAINSKGLRNRETQYSHPDGTIRIMMLGDSLTFGWGVREEETFARRLESILNGTGIKTEVINAGVGNYNTSMEVAYFLSEGYKYNPDVVVLNYFINDAEKTPTYDVSKIDKYSASWIYFASRLDIIARYAKAEHKANWEEYYNSLYDTKSPLSGWNSVEESFGKLVVFCRKKGIKLVFVVYPEIRRLSPYPFQPITEKIEALVTHHEVPFIDMIYVIKDQNPSSLWVTPLDPHPNAKADALFAKGLSERLVSQGIIPSAP